MKRKKGVYKITKKDFIYYGGLSNSNLFRKMIKGKWFFYRILY